MFPYANTRAEHYHLSVGALIRDHFGSVLMLRRPSGVHLLPTETMRPGETLLDALMRGIREEAGVTAALVRYLGATDMPFCWDGVPYEKTVLWHELQLLVEDASTRATVDSEAEATALWMTPDAAAAVFVEQGRRLHDWDFSPAIARLT